MPGCPPVAFTAQGQVNWTEPGIVFKGSTLKVAGDQLTLDGLVGMQPAGSKVDLRIAMQGRDPRLLAWFLNQPALPARPYTLAGRLRRDRNAWRVDGGEAQLAGARLRLNGQVGNPPALKGTNLSFLAEGPDLAPFSGVAGRPLPKAPFRAAGNLASQADAIRLQQLTVTVGDLKLSGGVTIGLPFNSARTDFDLGSTGQGLVTLLPELDWLPLLRQSAAVTAKGTWQKNRLSIGLFKVATDSDTVSLQGDVALAPVVSMSGLQLTCDQQEPVRCRGTVRREDSCRIPPARRGPAVQRARFGHH